MAVLESRGIGFPVGVDGTDVVPIVPAAVIYDLGRGGAFGNRPEATFGRRATMAARHRAPSQGSVGAGTGAMAGGLQGGVGTASTTLADGTVVGAIAVVNSAGSVIDPATGLPWEAAGHRLRRPSRTDRTALEAHWVSLRPPLNTTIGVVATSVALSKAECQKFASVAHDGLARAVRPAHSMFDGDTIFGLSTGVGAPSVALDGLDARQRAVLLGPVFEAGALCFAAACTRAVLLASSHPGGPPSFRDLCPSAYR
jgi:L-aminopeptidase/D-esterase-like protein